MLQWKDQQVVASEEDRADSGATSAHGGASGGTSYGLVSLARRLQFVSASSQEADGA